MIDYLSLAIGHGLLAIAFFRLVMRADLDVDPAVAALEAEADAARQVETVAGRNASRRASRSARIGDGSLPEPPADQPGDPA